MEYLRAPSTARPVGVDRKAGVIFGVIVAEEGPFKSEGRGEFDSKAISQIVRLARDKPNGLRTRFGHPNLSDDGFTKYSGRTVNIRRDKLTETIDGRTVERAIARGDHVFAKSAFSKLNIDKTEWVMDAAQEDSEALGMSLVLSTDEEYRLDAKGNPKIGDDGQPLPPLWRPTRLHAVDFVDTGDATNSLLSQQQKLDGIPDSLVLSAERALRHNFRGKPRAFVQERLDAYVQQLLDHHWPLDEEEDAEATQDLRRRWEFTQTLLTQ